MRRRTFAVAAGLLSAAVLAGVVALGFLEDPVPEILPPPPAPPAPVAVPLADDLGSAGEVGGGPAPWEEAAAAAAPRGGGGSPSRAETLLPEPDWWERQAEVLRDTSWKAYPEGGRGPYVVGVIVKAGATDPAAWVALEDLDHPGKEDPSVVESLNWGRFRLSRFEPGRYRVRAKTDDGCAVYSDPFTVGPGECVDAGVLRLQQPGAISGAVHAPDGTCVKAVVRLFGRDPASLEPCVVETVTSAGREGFRLSPHEAGEFTLGVVAREGYAVHGGATDGTGLGWAEVQLHRWCRVGVSVAPAGPDGPEARVLNATLRPRETAPLGVDPEVRTRAGAGAFEHVVHGRYRIEVRWMEAGAGGGNVHDWGEEIVLSEGEQREVVVPR